MTAVADAAAGLPAGATMRLAAFAAGLTLDDLPPDYRARLQLFLLDNLGVTLAGCVQPVHARVARAMAVAAGEGAHEAVGGARLPFSSAVLLDGVCAAGFEFEHVIHHAHPASAVFPAVLALAAARTATGADFLAAVAAGYESATRIGFACTGAVEHERGFHNPGVNGTVAAASGCARLLGLDAAGCASAMGLAGSSSAGLMAFVDTGAMTKRLHPARSCQLGLEAALMAQAGVEGPETVLENGSGLLRAFSPAPDPSQLLCGLGTAWKSAGMIMKLAPVHAYAQHFVHAVTVAREGGEEWRAREITDVEVEAGPASIAGRHMDRAPRTLVAAQYSVPFSIAVAIARDLRNPLLLDDGVLTDPEVRRLAGLMRFRTPAGDPKRLGGTVRLTLAGRHVDLDASVYPGLPGASGYAAGVSRKFDQVLAALGIETHGPALRRAVDGIAGADGPATLRRTLLAAAGAIGRQPLSGR